MFPSGGVTPLWANNGIFNRPPFWFPLPLTLHGTGKDDAIAGNLSATGAGYALSVPQASFMVNILINTYICYIFFVNMCTYVVCFG
jgi:hypothetical protein